MRHSRGWSLGSTSVAVLTLVLVLSGSGTTPTSAGVQQAAEWAPVAAAQATPVSTATPRFRLCGQDLDQRTREGEVA
jgi:hypothetical protein